MAAARTPAALRSYRRPPLQLRAAAEYCGLSVDWLKRRIAAGEITSIKTTWKVLVMPDELDRYLAEHTVTKKPRKKSKRAS